MNAGAGVNSSGDAYGSVSASAIGGRVVVLIAFADGHIRFGVALDVGASAGVSSSALPATGSSTSSSKVGVIIGWEPNEE